MTVSSASHTPYDRLCAKCATVRDIYAQLMVKFMAAGNVTLSALKILSLCRCEAVFYI